MSRSKSITAASLAVVVMIGVVVGIAQSHKDKEGPHGNPIADHHARMIEHLTEGVGLSAEQKTKVEQIIADSSPRFKDIHTRLAAAHKESMEAGSNGIYDEARATASASRQAEIVKQGFLEFEKMKAAIFATLTDEQRARAKKMIGEMAEKFGH